MLFCVGQAGAYRRALTVPLHALSADKQNVQKEWDGYAQGGEELSTTLKRGLGSTSIVVEVTR